MIFSSIRNEERRQLLSKPPPQTWLAFLRDNLFRALRKMVSTRLKVAPVLVLSVGLVGLGTAFARYPTLVSTDGVVSESEAGDKLLADLPKRASHAEPAPAGAIVRIGSARFRFLRSAISQIAYSSNGRLLAVAGHGKKLETVLVIWDARTGKQLHQFQQDSFYKRTKGQDGFPDKISALAFSPDGKTLAFAVEWPEANVYLWELSSGEKEPRVLPGCRAPFVFSHDGKLLAAPGIEGSVRLWSMTTGKEQNTLAGSAGPVAVTGDGKLLATAGMDKHIHIWELPAGKEVGKLAIGMENNQEASIFPESFAFAPSGPMLTLRWGVRGYDSGWGTPYSSVMLKVWDIGARKKILQLPEGRGRTGLAWVSHSFVAFSPDGKTLYSRGISEQVLHAVEMATWNDRFKIEGIGDRIVLSPDGKTLASWEGRTVRFWDTATAKERVLLPDGHSQTVWQLAFTPDGKMLVSASNDGSINLWDPMTGKKLHGVRPDYPHYLVRFAFALGGKALVVRGLDRFSTWDLATGKELHSRENNPLAMRDWAHDFEVSPDGRLLAWAPGRKIRLADIATGKELEGFDDNIPRGLAFSPDGKLLAQVKEDGGSGTGRCTVFFWDLDSRRVQQNLPVSCLSFPRVRFLADSRVLATEDDAGVRFWDVASGKELRRIAGRRWVGFSPDDKRIIVGTVTGQVLYVHDTASGQELYSLREPRGWGTRAAFSPDGRVLVLAGADGNLRLLDAATGKERRTLRGHEAPVADLGFSPDGRMLASGSEDTTIIIWDIKAATK